jgi:hypothetical protein
MLNCIYFCHYRNTDTFVVPFMDDAAEGGMKTQSDTYVSRLLAGVWSSVARYMVTERCKLNWVQIDFLFW